MGEIKTLRSYHSGCIPFCKYKYHKGIIKEIEEVSCMIKNCLLYVKMNIPTIIKDDYKFYIKKIKRRKILNP